MRMVLALKSALIDGVHYLAGDPIDVDALDPALHLPGLEAAGVLPKTGLAITGPQRHELYAFGKRPDLALDGKGFDRIDELRATGQLPTELRDPASGALSVTLPAGSPSQTPDPSSPRFDGPGPAANIPHAPDSPGAGDPALTAATDPGPTAEEIAAAAATTDVPVTAPARRGAAAAVRAS